MTKKELLEELEGVPDEAIICRVADFYGEYIEVSSVETVMGAQYYDMEDEVKTGNIFVL